MNARITLIGIENYLNDLDEPKSITDACILDNEESQFDPEVLLAAIMMKGGTFEPLYTDPLFYYKMVGMWWKKWLPTFNAWDDVLMAEYNPIWNKDAYEEIHEDTLDVGTDDTATTDREVIDRDLTGSKTGKEIVDDDTTFTSTTNDDIQLSGKDKTTHDSDRDISVSNNISAYDAPSNNPMVPQSSSHTDDTLNSENTETTYGKKSEEDISTTGSATDDRTTDTTENTTGTEDVVTNKTGSIDNDSTNDRDFDRTAHTWGNVGVTTSQQMVEAELKLRYFNLYQRISDIFVDELCVRVY